MVTKAIIAGRLFEGERLKTTVALVVVVLLAVPLFVL